MFTDKPENDQSTKKSTGQGKRAGDRKAQLQEESLKIHGDKLEHPKIEAIEKIGAHPRSSSS